MIARYDAVSGTAGAGAQAAVPEAVYGAFERAAGDGAALEAYASPLNHRMHRPPSQPLRFGTAFADTDAPFGGVGRFETCAARLLADGGGGGGGGAAAPHQLLLINPPFGPRDMLSMAAALEQQLAARRDGVPLTAVVVVPTLSARAAPGGEAPHMAALEASPHIVASARLAAGQHAYVHGLAHRRTRVRSVLRAAAHESAVLVLSTHPERARLGGAVVDAVRRAFESIR